MTDHALAHLNSTTLGVKMPEVSLADGSVVQTGSVGALLQNIRAYNQAHAAGDEAAMVRLREAMRAPVAMLHRVGLFEMLVTAREIVDGAGPRNEGRRVFGGLVLEYEEALGRAEADGGGSG